MKIILLEKIEKLGSLGDVVEVKNGYARNFLLPTKSALTPSPENLEVISTMKDELIKKEQELKEAAMSLKEKLIGYSQTHKVKVKDDSNELFGSITLQNIMDRMKEDGHPIEKKQVNLPSGAIKELGTYNVNVSLHSEVACDVIIVVEKSEEESQ